MSAVIVAAIAANAAAQQAAAQAQREHIARCTNEIALYSPQKASVTQMQSYAECVRTIYPVDNSHDIVTGKIFVGILLLSILIGAIVGCVSSDYDRGMDTIMGGIAGLCISIVVLTLLGVIAFVVS